MFYILQLSTYIYKESAESILSTDQQALETPYEK